VVAKSLEPRDETLDLAEDLLLIARSDAGGLPIRRERISASAVLDVVAERFSGQAGRRGQTLEAVPPNGLVLDADPVRLEQALGNLVDNALEHGSGRIVLSARPRGELVELHVEDEGARVPAGVHRRRLRPLQPLARRAQWWWKRARTLDRGADRAGSRRRGWSAKPRRRRGGRVIAVGRAENS
jgi:signal transduction histidine kinase